MTKGSRLSKRKQNVLRRDDYFYFHHYSFEICITDQAWCVQYDWIYGQISFLFFFLILLDFLKVLYFLLLGYATRLLRLLGRYATSRIEALFDRSLLRTYERSTCSKSSIVFTDTKSRAMKKRTTPIYAICTSPIMHLICPPKFCISIIFNFSWDGCNIQEKWKTTWKVMQNLGKVGGRQAYKVHYGRCASAESSYLDRTYLVKKVFVLQPNSRGFDSQRFVLLLFSILRVGRPPRH